MVFLYFFSLTLFLTLLRLPFQADFTKNDCFKMEFEENSPFELTYSIERKDLHRREDKGRRCSLGNKIASIPCRAIAILHQDDLKNRIICNRTI